MMTHKEQQNDEEDRVYSEIMQALPEFPKMLTQMITRIENFDTKQPQTELESIKAGFSALSTSLEKRQGFISRIFKRLIRGQLFQATLLQSVDHLIHIAKQEAIADGRYSLLLKLMSEADQQVPLVSTIVCLRHGDLEKSLSNLCKPVPHLDEAKTLSGEARAIATLDALVKTAEGLYRPYLITLQQLSYLKDGERPPKPVDFGDLVKVMSIRLAEYPGLIDSEAGWIRNSAAHLNYKYIVGKDEIQMWDKKHAAINISVNELLNQVEEMYRVSSWTIQRVGQLYLLRNLLRDTGLLKEIVARVPVLCYGNSEEISRAETEILLICQELFTPMTDFFKSH